MKNSRIIRYDHNLSPEEPFKVDHHTYPELTTAPRTVPMDMHSDIHFGIMLEGSFTSIFSDFQQPIHPGQIWLTAPWEPHTSKRNMHYMELILITLPLDRIGTIGLSEGIFWQLPFLLPPAKRPQLHTRRACQEMVSRGKELLQLSQSCYRKTRQWLKIHEIILMALDTLPATDEQDDLMKMTFMRIYPALELLQKEYGHPISVDEAASSCQLGKSRFCDLFKSAMGTSFGKYELRSRLSNAIKDVKQTTLPLKEIAEKWGFFDQSHFYRLFKQQLQVTPGQFRTFHQLPPPTKKG